MTVMNNSWGGSVYCSISPLQKKKKHSQLSAIWGPWPSSEGDRVRNLHKNNGCNLLSTLLCNLVKTCITLMFPPRLPKTSREGGQAQYVRAGNISWTCQPGMLLVMGVAERLGESWRDVIIVELTIYCLTPSPVI